MHILVTGAQGYIGQHLCHSAPAGVTLHPASLRQQPVTDLPLSTIDTVMHLSALVHQPDASTDDYFRINLEQTRQLAHAAKAAGVKRFVFFSTMAVYGGHGSLSTSTALTEQSPCQPDSPYGQSKYAAEQALQALADDRFSVAIIRPPMVYGPGCPGNMVRLQKLIRTLPLLPFDWPDNQRSLVAIDNLLALSWQVIQQPVAGIFLPQDPTPLSIKTMVSLLAQAEQQQPRLIRPPHWLLQLASRLQPRLTHSLYGSLYYDNRQTCQTLSFIAPQSSAEAFHQMCQQPQKDC